MGLTGLGEVFLMLLATPGLVAAALYITQFLLFLHMAVSFKAGPPKTASVFLLVSL